MRPIIAFAFLTLFTILSIFPAYAQDDAEMREIVWGTVIYTTIGDSSPETWKDRALTSLGGQQLYDAGTAIAGRYIRSSSSDTVISGISSQNLVNSELDIIAKNDPPAVGSAMAFMQGLYPVHEDRDKRGPDSGAYYPYAGYQYPLVKTASDDSQLFVQVSGNEECPNYAKAINTYAGTDEFAQTMNETEHFYKELGRHDLRDAFTEGSVSYSSASPVWDYLRYQYPRNSSLQTSISQAELVQARELASKFEWAVNSQVTMDKAVGGKDIRAIHGKTLARSVINAIRDNIDSKGVHNKMTLLFGDHRPMMAFASLTNLASRRQPTFYTLPNGGASFIFELFSYAESPTNDTAVGSKYPKEDLLNVRFFMRNETSSSEANFRSYPMFDLSPSKIAMPLSEFLSSMKNISVQPAEWCKLCGSTKPFCSRRGGLGTDHDLLDDDDDEWDNPNRWRCSNHEKRVYAVQGGLLGAISTILASVILIFLISRSTRSKNTQQNHPRRPPPRPHQGSRAGGNVASFVRWIFGCKSPDRRQASDGATGRSSSGVPRPEHAHVRNRDVGDESWQRRFVHEDEDYIELMVNSRFDGYESTTVAPSNDGDYSGYSSTRGECVV